MIKKIYLLFVFLFYSNQCFYIIDSENSNEDIETSTKKDYNFNRYVFDLKNKTLANLCYCSMGEDACDIDEKTCLKETNAACFHSKQLIYDLENRRMTVKHTFGCAALEKGSNASHLTCNMHRNPHSKPYSIACCYEGRYCNRKLVPPPFSNFHEDLILESDKVEESKAYIFIIIFASFGIVIILITYLIYKKCRLRLNKNKNSSFKKTQSICSDSDGEYSEESSGAGYASLNQRTVAQYLQFLNEVARGRYGCVQTAYYRTRIVAVKTFYTSEEESWRNERDIYLTQMLNHENILQFVAADICSVDSMTKMLLITDFHSLGSLYDYLRSREYITIDEALNLALTTTIGLEHLHTKVFGTASKYKPEIAHRDIKSKNIIVKQKGVCCIADFGLAVRLEDGKLIPSNVNRQAGTRRYMSPEVLSNILNIENFVEFKKSDIYSLSLVFWEIFKRVEMHTDTLRHDHANNQSTDSGIAAGSSDSNENLIRHQAVSNAENAPLMGNVNNSITKPFELSYSEYIVSDPSIEQMRVLVCDNGKRPTIPEIWNKDHRKILPRLAVLMQEMWVTAPQSRHTALKVKVELDKIIKSQKETITHQTHQMHLLVSRNNTYMSSDGFATRQTHP